MKKLNLVLVAAFALASLPAFADPAPAATSTPATAVGDRSSNLAKSTIGAAQDTAITTYIYAKLASHPSLSSSNLDISTTGGKVTLNGIVNDESQAKEVQQIAENTAGVKGVDASRIIVSQQDSSLYVKTSSSLPVAQPDQATQSEITPVQTVAQTEPAPAQPQAQTAPAPSPQDPAAAQAQMKLTSADPLADNPAARPDASKPALEAKKSVKQVRLSRNPAKHKHQLALKKHHHPKKIQAAARKLRHFAHKKPAQHKMVAHLHHPHHKKTLAHVGHHGKKAEKHLAARSHQLAERIKTAHRVSQKTGTEKLKKHEVASKKGEHESVDQMTNSFLKTALTANQTIPEE